MPARIWSHLVSTLLAMGRFSNVDEYELGQTGTYTSVFRSLFGVTREDVNEWLGPDKQISARRNERRDVANLNQFRANSRGRCGPKEHCH